MRKTVLSALLTALSLASLSLAAPSAPKATAPNTAKPAAASQAQSAPAVPATAAPAVSGAPLTDTASARAAGDTSGTPAVPAAPLPAAAAAAIADSAAPDTVQAAPAKVKKRKRVVRETTVNTIDELKGRYRSPKKALFMSLLVPGLGQAYVGQHWFNYARGAGYLVIDVGLILGWNHYVNTKQDRQIAKYRRFADENWSLSRYEDSISLQNSKGFNVRNDQREQYCQAVQSREGNGSALYQACLDPLAASNRTNYDTFRNNHSDQGLDADSVGTLLEEFPGPHDFYELIGKYSQFVNGWKDAEDVVTGDSSYTDSEGNQATTDLREEYVAMRSKATDYARMQAWFLGGMVLNHIVSALDAAFAANFHNKSLYQTEVGFLERLRFDSGLAWEGNVPRPSVTASLTF